MHSQVAFATRSVGGSHAAAICYEYPEEGAGGGGAVVSARLLGLQLRAMAAMQPGRWLESGIVGDVFGRKRDAFAQVSMGISRVGSVCQCCPQLHGCIVLSWVRVGVYNHMRDLEQWLKLDTHTPVNFQSSLYTNPPHGAIPPLQMYGKYTYMCVVGVSPEQQGQGMGGTLVQAVCAAADARAQWTYVEATSERAALLYERFGFIQLEVLQHRESAPATMLMARAPGRSSTADI
eukprot:365898-Chlamydomonas_euryale.AAC.10